MAGLFKTKLIQVFSSSTDAPLRSVLQAYIDNEQAMGNLKQLLEQTSVDTRYHLLTTVRGVIYNKWTGLHISAWCNDFNMVRCMLEGFTSDQVYNVLTIREPFGLTALDYASLCGNLDAVEYIVEKLPKDRMLALLSLKHSADNSNASSDEKLHKRFNLTDNMDHWPTLHCGVHSGSLKLVKVLLQGLPQCQVFKAITHSSPRTGSTALHLCVAKRNIEMVQYLLENLNEEQRFGLVAAQNSDGFTVLHLAAQHGLAEITGCILQNIAESDVRNVVRMEEPAETTNGHDMLDDLTNLRVEEIVQIQAKDGETALHMAAENGHLQVVDHLLSRLTPQQRADLAQRQGPHGATPLYLAAQNGHVLVVKHIIDPLPEVDKVDSIKIKASTTHSALHVAASHKQTAVVDAMLHDLTREHKYNLVKLASTADNSTALHYAARDGDINMIAQIRNGLTQQQWYDVNCKRRWDGVTAFHLAVQNKHVEAAERLITDLTEQQKLEFIQKSRRHDEVTALHIAAQNGQAQLIERMLANLTGPDIYNVVSKERGDGVTAVHLAALNGHANVVKILLGNITQQQRVDLVRKQGPGRQTALHVAASEGYLEFVRCVLQQLNEPNRFLVLKDTTVDGNAPLHIAMREDKREMALTMIFSLLSSENQKTLVDAPNSDGQKMADVFPDIVRVVTSLSALKLDDLYTDIATDREHRETVVGLKAEIETMRRATDEHRHTVAGLQTEIERMATELTALREKQAILLDTNTCGDQEHAG